MLNFLKNLFGGKKEEMENAPVENISEEAPVVSEEVVEETPAEEGEELNK